MTAAPRSAVTCGKHISLAGALAVTVGIGVAVADSWTASASPADPGASSTSETAPPSAARTTRRDERTTAGSPTARRHRDREDPADAAQPRRHPFRNRETVSNDVAQVDLSPRRLTRSATTGRQNSDAPAAPVDSPTALTLLALARRDTEQSASADPVVRHRPRVADDVTAAAPVLDAPVFTGRPSLLSKTVSAVFGAVGKIGSAVKVDLPLPLTGLLQSDHPPRRTRRGLTVDQTEFEGMPVWTMQSVRSTSQEAVVAVHGGALVLQPTVFNWLFYSAMARTTGATVIVPLYPLVPVGTAREVVPAVADLISAQIDQRGVENVSVFGDSSGANIALAATQELVRSGRTMPSRMVLSAPGVDSTLSNPAISLVDDPLFTPEVLADLRTYVDLWADGLDLTDPLLSPLFGSLAGLPPTTVYVGSRDIVAPDLLLLREKAAATPGADFTFVLRKGEPHDWAIFTILPETRAILPDIYRQLGIA